MNLIERNEDHPLYSVWKDMRRRCLSKTCEAYHNYGGRGIAICSEWDHFWTFVFDMGPKPSPKHSIDRIDNDGHYAPWNCRWATQKEQIRNSRHIRLLTHMGETMCILDWANRIGITPSAISHRIRKRGVAGAFK